MKESRLSEYIGKRFGVADKNQRNEIINEIYRLQKIDNAIEMLKLHCDDFEAGFNPEKVPEGELVAFYEYFDDILCDGTGDTEYEAIKKHFSKHMSYMD